MSGHSKWSTIKRQKGATDAKRGKIFTRHAKLIQVAARESGGDPAMNTKLAVAIENAKTDNLPKDNIERAIKRGTGELASESIEEKTYEAYGPSGVALLISVLTDNTNRTVSNLRHLLTKAGGKLAESGSVAFQFEKRGVLAIPLTGKSADDAELAAIDAGATETEIIAETLIVKTAPEHLMTAKKKLEESGLKVSSAKLVVEPTTTVSIAEKPAAEQILKLIDTLEEDDDVDSVSANFDILDDLMKELE